MPENRVRIVLEAQGGQAEKAVDGVRKKFRGLAEDTDVAARAMLSSFEVVENTARTAARAMGEAFGDFFFNNITGQARSLEDYLNRFTLSVARSYSNMLGQQVAGNMLSGLAGLFSARGNVFEQGRVLAFASGGVVSGPTYFPLGLMGEAGPEAILPLERTPSGDLGVKAVGRGGDVVNNNFTINLTAWDGRSVARTLEEHKRHIVGMVQEAYNRRGKPGPVG